MNVCPSAEAGRDAVVQAALAIGRRLDEVWTGTSALRTSLNALVATVSSSGPLLDVLATYNGEGTTRELTGLLSQVAGCDLRSLEEQETAAAVVDQVVLSLWALAHAPDSSPTQFATATLVRLAAAQLEHLADPFSNTHQAIKEVDSLLTSQADWASPHARRLGTLVGLLARAFPFLAERQSHHPVPLDWLSQVDTSLLAVVRTLPSVSCQFLAPPTPTHSDTSAVIRALEGTVTDPIIIRLNLTPAISPAWADDDGAVTADRGSSLGWAVGWRRGWQRMQE